MTVGIAVVVIDASLLTEDNSIHLLIRLSGTLVAFVSFIVAMRMWVKENSSSDDAYRESLKPILPWKRPPTKD